MTSTNTIADQLRVSPYGRISDTDEERAPGIDRQLRVIHPLIEARGAVATRDYIDNNKSAYQDGVYRDDFEQWLQDFKDNKNDGVIAWDQDRLVRRNDDLERVIAAYCQAFYKQGRPKPAWWTPSLTLDLTDPDGQFLARMLVSMANQSSGKTAKRMGSFYRDEALKGKVYSNHPAFYRNPDGTINEAKAAIARQAADDIIGQRLRVNTIATAWRKQGITTAYGGAVTGETVRRILISPGIAGLAVYKGELLLDTDGKPIKRVDGGIVDEDIWRALCQMLGTTKGRRQKSTRGLLSPILRCGNCGSGMARRQSKRKSGLIWHSYECSALPENCPLRLGIAGAKLDAQVTKLVVAYLEQPIEADESQIFTGEARLAEVSEKIAELMEAYRSGGMSGSVVFPLIKQLEEEQRELTAQQAKSTRVQKRVTTLAAEWPTLELDRQHAIIDMIFEAIVIMPAKKRRGGAYDPERVQPVYRKLDLLELQRRIASVLSSRRSLALAA